MGVSIDVVIPTYNRAELIKRSIQSVLNQTYSCSKIIVVDDGSTDNTEDVIAEIGDKRILYVKNKENHGANYCRNIGIELSEADYIAFNDSDDVWHYNKLEQQIKFLKKNKECEAVFCPYILIDGDRKKTIGECAEEDIEFLFKRLLIGNVIGTPTLIISKKIKEELGGFDNDMPRLQDLEYSLRISKNYKVGYVQEPLVTAYRTEDSLTNNFNKTSTAYMYLIRKFHSEIKNYGMSLKWLNMCRYLFKEDSCKMKEAINYLCDDDESGVFFADIDNEIKIRRLNFYLNLACELSLKRDLVLTNLRDYKQSNVLIYGNGKIGNLLAEILSQDGFKNIILLDRYNMKNDHFEVIKYEKYIEKPTADIVINTVMELEDEIDNMFFKERVENLSRLFY